MSTHSYNEQENTGGIQVHHVFSTFPPCSHCVEVALCPFADQHSLSYLLVS